MLVLKYQLSLLLTLTLCSFSTHAQSTDNSSQKSQSSTKKEATPPPSVVPSIPPAVKSKPKATETPPKVTPPSTTTEELFQSLDYPELQVIPSASERLRIQASDESRSGWYGYWPIQVSSATLLAAAMLSSSHQEDRLSASEKDEASRAKNIGLAVGSAWIVGTALFSLSKPYRTGFKKLSDFPSNSRADRLRRERLAEEQLQYPADVAKKLKYFAFGTNFVASIAMMPNLDNSGQIILGISALTAFLPLIFDTTYEATYDKHIEYKRKIYLPLVSYQSGTSSLLATRVDKITMTWTF